MRAYLATGILGSFAFDADRRVIEKRLFPKRPDIIAEKLEQASALPEELDILKALVKKGYKEVFTDRPLPSAGIAVVQDPDNVGKRALAEEFRSLAVSLKWVTSQAELNELLSQVNVLRTKQKLKEERKDKIIMICSRMLGELEKDLNAFSERLREWYGLHFPELASQGLPAEEFAELVGAAGDRSRMKGYESLAKTSAGMDFSGSDVKEVQSLAKALADLYQEKASLASYLEKLCREMMPTTSAVAGELLAAKLISQAGGLEKLSRMPSSTVQLLGAEKALFRHLKGQGKSPKYGLLFAHPLVQAAAPGRKGKIARLIAAKISLASRTDFYSKADKGQSLRRELEEEAKRAQ